MKKRTTKKQFDLFKKHCLHYQKVFGLVSWRLYFKIGNMENESAYGETDADVDGHYAAIHIEKYTNMSAKEIKETALHEIIHIVLARYRRDAFSRHTTSREICEAEEEVVNTFENILKDII